MDAPNAALRLGLAPQRGHLAEWVPICLAIGIGGYFALPAEPGTLAWATLALGVALLAAGAARCPENWRPLVTALVLVGLGVGAAGLRSHLVAGPVLDFRYYGPIEGRIRTIDRSASDAVRLTLDEVVLARMAPQDTPRRVRVSLHGTQGFIDPRPGLRVVLTGHLAPPAGPVEPGGFDFRRQAWFQRLGAVGYTRTPVLEIAPVRASGPVLAIDRLRRAISAGVQAALPGRTGAFAAAVTTGDRSALDRPALEDLRRSNLAHLLAISGLHMGLLTGLVFGAVRLALALMPSVALRWPTRPIAAASALMAGAAYLALSGGNVATLRAFIMAAVVLVAVMLGRRALTLRAVAVAATLILLATPEALLCPGFQMSFAATTALVAIFAALGRGPLQRLPRWLRPVGALVISSAVAGLATAPVAAAHFNRIADYGLLANLAAVPAMGLLVMPGAILAALLWPLGLQAAGLALMQLGTGWILWVAARVAALPGATSHVVAAPPAVLPLMALGALWAVLWQGPWRQRALGLAPMALAAAIWAGAERPALLVADTGGLVGLMGERGRILSKPRGDGFAARVWLENDGDPASQAEAAARGPLPSVIPMGPWRLAHLTGRGAADRGRAACRGADIVVLSVDAPDPGGPCLWFDERALAREGSLAITLQGGQPHLVTARMRSGNRPWNASGPG